MLDLMRHNIVHNGLSGKVEAYVYDWGEPRPGAIPENVDIILAADCVYFEPAFPLLLKTLQDLLGPNSICYFCFKKRRRADMHFVKSIKKAFVVTEVEDDPDKEIYKRESIHLSETNQPNGSLLMRCRLKIEARS
jgi:protein N-lysine methyltransferase METTL21A